MLVRIHYEGDGTPTGETCQQMHVLCLSVMVRLFNCYQVVIGGISIIWFSRSSSSVSISGSSSRVKMKVEVEGREVVENRSTSST